MKKIILLSALALGTGAFLLAAQGGNSFSHGRKFDTPEAKVKDEIAEGPELLGATPLPAAPKLSNQRELTVRLDIVHKLHEVGDGTKMWVWTFGGDAPGPTVRVRQGDKIKFIMANRSMETAKLTPPMPHSMDFHAAMVSPQDKFRSIGPGQTLEFEFVANYPGVYMYHCGTPMILHHLALGMYGAVIVEPKEGYPTKVDREYVIVQSEWYPAAKADKDGSYPLDLDAVLAKRPTITAFNEQRGGQSVLLGASNSAIVEFEIPAPGKYIMVDHEFADANAGAIGLIDAGGGEANE